MVPPKERFYNNANSYTYWLVFVSITLLCAAGCAAIPVTFPMPSYWRDALDFSTYGHLLQDFTPAGYPELLGMAIRLAPSHAIVCLLTVQIAIHLGTALTIWKLLRLMGIGLGQSLVCALVFQLHPELLLSISKVWDVPLSTLLFLGLVVSVLTVRSSRGSLFSLATCGAMFGVGIFERPNFVFLLPLVLLVPFLEKADTAGGWRAGPALAQMFAVICVAIAVYSVGSEVAYGRFDTPHNGPYNLYAGQNLFTEEALEQHLNAEQSILPGLRSSGYWLSANDLQRNVMNPLYISLSENYVKQHPIGEIRLIWFKFLTLFRPDTKVHPARSGAGSLKVLEALIAPLWLLTLLYVFGWLHKKASAEDLIVFSSVILYVIPFLITNSDPRFRLPLDMLLLASLVSILKRSSFGSGSGKKLNVDQESTQDPIMT